MTRGMPHLGDSERIELVACIEAGAAARQCNVVHFENPHLIPLGEAVRLGAEKACHLRRIEAWWDGWEEVDRADR